MIRILSWPATGAVGFLGAPMVRSAARCLWRLFESLSGAVLGEWRGSVWFKLQSQRCPANCLGLWASQRWGDSRGRLRPAKPRLVNFGACFASQGQRPPQTQTSARCWTGSLLECKADGWQAAFNWPPCLHQRDHRRDNTAFFIHAPFWLAAMFCMVRHRRRRGCSLASCSV